MKKNVFSDITITINNYDYHLHKDIIEEKSKYFKLLMNNNFIKEDKFEINICDKNENLLDYQYIKAIIEYLYTGKVSISRGTIYEYYYIAKILIIDILIDELYRMIVVGLMRFENKNLLIENLNEYKFFHGEIEFV